MEANHESNLVLCNQGKKDIGGYIRCPPILILTKEAKETKETKETKEKFNESSN